MEVVTEEEMIDINLYFLEDETLSFKIRKCETYEEFWDELYLQAYLQIQVRNLKCEHPGQLMPFETLGDSHPTIYYDPSKKQYDIEFTYFQAEISKSLAICNWLIIMSLVYGNEEIEKQENFDEVKEELDKLIIPICGRRLLNENQINWLSKYTFKRCQVSHRKDAQGGDLVIFNEKETSFLETIQHVNTYGNDDEFSHKKLKIFALSTLTMALHYLTEKNVPYKTPDEIRGILFSEEVPFQSYYSQQLNPVSGKMPKISTQSSDAQTLNSESGKMLGNILTRSFSKKPLIQTPPIATTTEQPTQSSGNQLLSPIPVEIPERVSKQSFDYQPLNQTHIEENSHLPNSISVVPTKEKIWPKILAITFGVVLTLGAIGLGLLTGGIGTALLAGIGAIGKTIAAHIAAHALICAYIAGGSVATGLITTIVSSVELHKARKNHSKILQQENNITYERLPESSDPDYENTQFREKLNSAPDRANEHNLANHQSTDDIEIPLLQQSTDYIELN